MKVFSADVPPWPRRCPHWIESCQIGSGQETCRLDPCTLQNSLGAVDHQIELDQRRRAEPVDEKQHFAALLWRNVLADRANEFLRNRIVGNQRYPASARLALNADAHFHFVVGEREVRAPRRRHGTRQQRQTHRARAPVDFIA